MDAFADGSDGYRCCCEQELWKEDHFAVADSCDSVFEATQCAWTSETPCEGQYKSSTHEGNAYPDGSDGYTCCCDLGYWKHAVHERIERLETSASIRAMCDKELESGGCAWTKSTPCHGQPRADNVTQEASDDGSLYYKCCCDMEMWMTHGAVAELPHEQDQAAVCDAYVVEEGCSWTAKWACPGQPHGGHVITQVANDGSVGYKCCCEQEYWKTDRSWLAGEMMFVHIPTNFRNLVEDTSATFNVWWPQKWPSFWKVVDMPDGSTCPKTNVPPQYLRSLGEPDSDVAPFKMHGTFCLTQHPYERAISEYLYSLSTEWGQSMANLYHTRLAEDERCTADGLNHFLQTALQKVEEGGKFLHDCHFVPQAEFIWGQDGYQWCNNILRAAELPHSFNDLMANQGYSPRLEEEAVMNTHANVCGNITTALLWDKTRLMIDTIYHSDFVRLNYTKGLF